MVWSVMNTLKPCRLFITGASGPGTTTLRRAIANQWGLSGSTMGRVQDLVQAVTRYATSSTGKARAATGVSGGGPGFCPHATFLIQVVPQDLGP